MVGQKSRRITNLLWLKGAGGKERNKETGFVNNYNPDIQRQPDNAEVRELRRVEGAWKEGDS